MSSKIGKMLETVGDFVAAEPGTIVAVEDYPGLEVATKNIEGDWLIAGSDLPQTAEDMADRGATSIIAQYEIGEV